MAEQFKKIKGTPRKEALGMDSLIPMFIKANGLSFGLNAHRILEAWDTVSGMSAYTLNRFYRDGKLYITLSSSMVRTHLEFQKADLITAINKHLETDPLFTKNCVKAGTVKEIILK